MLRAVHPLAVAVLCSRRAPGLLELACSVERGLTYELACCVTSEPEFADRADLEARGVPVLSHPIAEFCATRGGTVYRDQASRIAYDAATVALLEPFAPDLVLLDGYVYLVTEPVLYAFRNRLVNLHLADLTLRGRDGAPVFPGIRSVRDAVISGATETRATTHLVDAVPDAGAPLVRSWSFPVSPMMAEARAWGRQPMINAYAFAHQEWMMRAASGPLLRATLRLIAAGRISLSSLAAADPAAVLPWDVEPDGRLVTPVESAAVIAAGLRL